jgi:type I restriction enzyme S subunit
VTGSWPLKALGDLFEISRGGSPRPIQDFLTEDVSGVNWIMISDASASGKYIERTAKRIRPEGVARSRQVSPGDFLLTNSMSFGRPYIMKTEGCIHDGWLHLKKRDKSIDEGYFYHVLGSEATYAKFERLAAGATVKNLNIDLVSGVKVPVPPLLEQRRIATILDKADNLRRKRQEATRLADELLRAVFIDIFGSPDGSSNWPQSSVAHMVASIESGWSAPSSDLDLAEHDLAVLKVSAVSTGLFLPNEAKAVDRAIVDRPLVFPRRGDLLFSRANTRELVAACCLVEEDVDDRFLPDKLWRITAEPKLATNEYLCYLFRHPAFRHELTKQATGTSGSMLNISQAKLLSTPAPLPPIALQEKFSSIAKRSQAARRNSLVSLRDLESLKVSLAAELLS